MAAAPLNALNGPLIAFVDEVARVAAGVPHAVIAVRLPGLLGAWRGTPGWRSPGSACESGAAPALVLPAIAAAGVAAGVLLGTRAPPVAAPRPGETVVSFLDVGQGDATLVQRDGAAMLVDTGPPEGRVVARLAAIGVRRLDALFITHAQRDHEGAALTVVRRLRPRLVVDGGAGWPTGVQRGLPAVARATRARIVRVAAGTGCGSGRCGSRCSRRRRPSRARRRRVTRTTGRWWCTCAAGRSTCC